MAINDQINTIVKQVLEVLARQKDAKQEIEIHGNVSFNPQTFHFSNFTGTLTSDTTNMSGQAAQQYLVTRGQDKRHYTMGPVMFTSIFQVPPDITFGQSPESRTNDDKSVAGPADNFVPFVVVPYVHAWHHTGGQVDGFYLGLYALTAPLSGTGRHFIYWKAVGRGSRYPGRGQTELWTQGYDFSQGNFLTDANS